MKTFIIITIRYIYLVCKIVLILLSPASWFQPGRTREKIQNEVNWTRMKVTHAWLNQVSYPRILKRIRAKVRHGEKIHVGFVVIDSAKWTVDSIFRELQKRPEFELTIYVFPDNQAQGGQNEGMKRTMAFFQDRGWNVKAGFDCETGKFASPSFFKGCDILFFDSPWHIVSVLRPENAGRYALVCYVPYGFCSAGNWEEAHYFKPIHSFAWRVFPETPWHVEQFKIQNPITHGENVVSFGYPKLDVLAEPAPPVEQIWKCGSQSLKRVIWAPHYSITKPAVESFHHAMRQWSTFHLIYREMLEYAKNHPEIEWLFKPHPVLFETIIKEGLMTREETENYYRQWETLPNTQACYDGNYWDFFKTSDAMITDSVSFLLEYLPTKKPIFRINSGNGEFNELVNTIISTYYKGDTMASIQSFLNDVVKGQNDFRAEERLGMLDKIPGIGLAGKKIVEFLIESLDCSGWKEN